MAVVDSERANFLVNWKATKDLRNKYECAPGARFWQAFMALGYRDKNGHGKRQNRTGSSQTVQESSSKGKDSLLGYAR